MMSLTIGLEQNHVNVICVLCRGILRCGTIYVMIVSVLIVMVVYIQENLIYIVMFLKRLENTIINITIINLFVKKIEYLI